MANDEIASTTNVQVSDVAVPGDVRTTKFDPFGGLGQASEMDLSSINIEDSASILDDPKADPNKKLNVLNKLQQEEANVAQTKQNDIILSAAKDAESLQAYNQKLNEVAAANQKLSQLNKPLLPKPLPGHYGLTPEKMAALATPGVKEEIAPAQQALADQKKQEDEQREFDKQAMQEQKRMLALDVAANKRVEDAQKRMDEAYAKYDADQAQLSEIDPNRFWANKSTGEKIFGIIGILLGGGKDGQNYAFDALNKAIDNDIAAQKVSNEQKIALKQNALRRVGMEVDRFSTIAKSEKDKNELKMMQQRINSELNAGKQQEVQRIALAKHLTSGNGLSAEEAAVVIPFDSPMRASLVTLPNGRMKLASGPDAASKFNTWNAESQKAQETSKVLEQQIREYQTGAFSDKLPYSAKRKEIQGTATALVGQLRLPFTGPGILNEKEYERLQDNIIGDATSLLRPDLALRQVQALRRLLGTMEGAAYKAAGIEYKQSPMEMKRQNLFREMINKGVPPADIEEAFKKLPNMN